MIDYLGNIILTGYRFARCDCLQHVLGNELTKYTTWHFYLE